MKTRETTVLHLLLLLLLTVALVKEVKGCPATCQCYPEGRSQRVECQDGGSLASLMGDLPQNTALLSLESFSLGHNLKEGDFLSAPRSLIQLRISHSGLQQLDDAAFSVDMASLQVLDLSQNSLKSLALESFSGLTSLRTLNLSHNQLRFLGSSLDPLVSLQQLDLSHNYLSQLQPTSVATLGSLTFLSLDGNKLRGGGGGVNFVESLQSLGFLSELRLRGCGLYSISDHFFSAIPRVTVLDLGGNRLSSFPSSTKFGDLRQLKHLYLDHNEIRGLSGHQFADLSLLTLTMAHNRISKLSPEALKGLAVEELDLSQNKLLQVSAESLEPVSQHLGGLSLAHNPLRSLPPDALQDLPLLHTLNLSACSLSVLPAEAFASLNSLRMLDVSWNHVQNVSEEFTKVLNGLSSVNLYHNPWYCDCHIRPFRDWLRSRNSAHKLICLPGQSHDDCSALRCSSPERLAERLISGLQDRDLETCSGGSRGGLAAPIQISIVLGCLLFSLGLLLLTLYLWRRGGTKKELKNVLKKNRAPKKKKKFDDDDEQQDKIAPFVDCDNESLKESHRSFVFRHYFDKIVTDPALLEPTSPSQMEPPDPYQQEGAAIPGVRDSVYSSDPNLYESSHHSHHTVVVGIESAV